MRGRIGKEKPKNKSVVVAILLMFMFSCSVNTSASADDNKTDVTGILYELDKNNQYQVDDKNNPVKTEREEMYGSLKLSGDVAITDEKSDVLSYEVSGDELKIFYNHDDSLLNTDKDYWHIVSDKSEKVSDINLGSSIGKGAIIVQTSKDRKNWINVEVINNEFKDNPVRTNEIYSATDVQLINGCYYRVVVVYKLSIRTKNSNFLFIDTDKYKSKKYAEVYEFYAYKKINDNNETDLNQTYSLGSKAKAKNFDGYYGETTISKNDAHYGWDLGNFFVSGYTDEVTDENGNVVFLKNLNDKVTLWFRLNQNIDKLNDKKGLKITSDKEGYDQYFETPRTVFGKGTLIIRYTDHNNVKSEPIIYTNYLEANAVIGADTKVQLFDEGDYEVALDYEITKDELVDKVGHYRIFFKFSVRNGNCMVYPFDLETGTELSNSSMTESGFRLDLAKSRYLKINLKREILKDSADGLVEDTRFNGPAEDGAEYTEEGIYTITTSNEYTGQLTTKKIYVGTNDILRAHMTTGLSIPEINSLVANGATISDDGKVQIVTSTSVDSETDDEYVMEESEPEEKENNSLPSIVLVIILFSFILLTVVLIYNKKKHSNKIENDDSNNEGGSE